MGEREFSDWASSGKKEILQRNRWHKWHSTVLFKIKGNAEQSFQGKSAEVLTLISLDKCSLLKVDTFYSNTFINHTDVHLITAWVLSSFRIFHHDQPDHSEPWVTPARMAAIKMAVELRGGGGDLGSMWAGSTGSTTGCCKNLRPTAASLLVQQLPLLGVHTCSQSRTSLLE